MRVVLDANQFVSAILVPLGHPAQILQAWREGRFELVLSPPIGNYRGIKIISPAEFLREVLGVLEED